MVKLPIEEYSDVRLQVMAKIHDEIITRAYKMEEYEGTIELRKINGKWLIYDWNEYQ